MFFWKNLTRFKKFFFFNKDISPTSNINFGSKKANMYFVTKLKKSKFYFEYGSGSSTLLAKKLNINFISLELDYFFFIKIKNIINNNNIKFINLGPVGEFSYPILKIDYQIKKYILYINQFFKKKKYPDLILIDGRFRIACCLNLLRQNFKILKKITIILDDYKKREKIYKTVKKFYNIKKIGRFAILSPKQNLKSSINIKKYFNDSQ